MLVKDSTAVVRQLWAQSLGRCPSTRNHRSLLKFHKYLHQHHGSTNQNHWTMHQNHGSIQHHGSTNQKNLTMHQNHGSIQHCGSMCQQGSSNQNHGFTYQNHSYTNQNYGFTSQLHDSTSPLLHSCQKRFQIRSFSCLSASKRMQNNLSCHRLRRNSEASGKINLQRLFSTTSLSTLTSLTCNNHFYRTSSSMACNYNHQYSKNPINQVIVRNQTGAIPLQRLQNPLQIFVRNYTSVHGNHDDPADPDSQAFCDYLSHLLMEYRVISKKLETDVDLTEGERYKVRQRELDMRFLVKQIELLDVKKGELKELEMLAKGGDSKEDKEMQQLALEEVETCLDSIKDMQKEIVSLLTPPAPSDENDILLELSCGVGGQEAMLFTGDMYEMYEQFAAYKGWKFDVVDYQSTDIGGLRSAIVSVSGRQVNQHMKYESGIHRVQRVPKTESRGRIHTSTMTVAILPQPKEIEINIEKKDLHIETMKASGAGGQHVNTTDSAVRISHIPSGIVVECQKERSQIKNKALALKILATRLYNQALQRSLRAERLRRKEQVGMAERSDKIRTYNFNANRVTDHRAGLTVHDIEGFMSDGEKLNELMESLMEEDQRLRLRSLIKDYAESKSASW